jgi:hypothetical protein
MKKSIDSDYLYDEVYWKLNYTNTESFSTRWDDYEEFIVDVTERGLIYQDMDGDFWALMDSWEGMI